MLRVREMERPQTTKGTMGCTIFTSDMTRLASSGSKNQASSSMPQRCYSLAFAHFHLTTPALSNKHICSKKKHQGFTDTDEYWTRQGRWVPRTLLSRVKRTSTASKKECSEAGHTKDVI